MAKAFWVTAPCEGSIAPADLKHEQPASSTAQWARVRTLYTGISRGTESLVYRGLVPESEYQSMRAPFQEGSFPFPVKYGYANVGTVIEGSDQLLGRKVFSLFPHQDEFELPEAALIPLPDGLPAERAVLAANMETAINGLWDGAPRVGNRIAVVGLGVVGLLVAWMANRIPGTRVTALDINPERGLAAERLGVDFATSLEHDDHDLVIHASGHPDGLATALNLCGQEATLIEMSWYGEQAVPAPLGQAFHSRRLTIRSSQVGQLHPDQRPRWSHRTRMELALNLLQDPILDHLITGESPFEQLPKVMHSLAGQSQDSSLPQAKDTLCHRIVY